MQAIIYISLVAAMLGLPPKEKLKPVPGYDWMAPRKRAKGPADPPPRPPVEVIDSLMTSLESSDKYDAKAIAFIKEERAKTADEDLVDFIDNAYSILSPEFRDGLELFDQDKVTEAMEKFETLAKSDDPFLAVASANMAASAMIEQELIDRCMTMLTSVAANHAPIEDYTTASDHFRFMLGYCQVHNLDYAEAYKTLEDFLKNHPESPERLRITAKQILTELDSRAPERIGDVRDIMNYARRKLSNKRVDDDLVEKQERAVALLNTLIEEAENQEQQQNGDGEGGGGGSDGGGDSQGQNPGGGANRSTKPSGDGATGELRRLRAKPGEAWGKMPPRDREKVLQTLQRRFPSQYRELLEQYYEQLAKDTPSQ